MVNDIRSFHPHTKPYRRGCNKPSFKNNALRGTNCSLLIHNRFNYPCGHTIVLGYPEWPVTDIMED